MWGTITGLYIACLALGFIYTLVGAIFGELGSHGDAISGGHGGVDAHDIHPVDSHSGTDSSGSHADVSRADSHDVNVSPLNSITIATFIGSFGAMGLIGLWGLKLDAWASLAFAIPTALLAASAQFYLYVKVLIGSSGSSEATLDDITNCTAEVITEVPENGVGEIAYVIKGFRYTAPARSVGGTEIPKGSRVRIVRAAAGVMQIREF